jgi:hypothetical protein
MWMRLWGHMAHVFITTPVGFANLGARLPFGLISLTRRYVEIEQPLPSFCVGNAAPPNVVRPKLVIVHPLLLPGQRLTAHVVRVILGPRHVLLLAMDGTTSTSCARSPTVSENAICTPVSCFQPASRRALQGCRIRSFHHLRT